MNTLYNRSSQNTVETQFDYMPYPGIGIEHRPRDPGFLFPHAIVTSHYLLKQRVVQSENRVILDAGCGTGYRSLALSIANPGSRIIAIDISQNSLDKARERLEFHQCKNVELVRMDLKDIEVLGYEFDYINCEDVLYLLEEPEQCLDAFASVLRMDGTMRLNFHSKAGRGAMLRAQEVLRMLGLMDRNPEEKEVELARKLMRSLKPGAILKKRTWDRRYEDEACTGFLLANQLLCHDRGCTVKEFFDMLRKSRLLFLNMVNWPAWELRTLFQDQDIPDDIYERLGMLSTEEQLHWYEMIHPRQRLFDLWCSKSEEQTTWKPLNEWDREWNDALIYLHPVFLSNGFQELCVRVIKEHRTVALQVAHSLSEPRYIDPILASLMLRLFDGPKTLDQLLAAGVGSFLSEQREIEDPKVWLRQITESMAELLYFLVEDGAVAYHD